MQISEIYTQVQDLINAAHQILLTTRKEPNLDGVAALLVLADVLKQKGKEVTALVEGFKPSHYQYLPATETIGDKLPPQNLIVSIDLNSTPIEKINYQTKEGKLEFVITPQRGSLDQSKVHFAQRSLKADLVWVINCQNLENLGEMSAIFKQSNFELPLINLDNSEQNSLFGKINWIDASQIAVSQMVYEFLRETSLDITPQIAFSILSALYFRTLGWQKNVTAPILRAAADLIEKGADYSLITQNVAIKASSNPAYLMDMEKAGSYIR